MYPLVLVHSTCFQRGGFIYYNTLAEYKKEVSDLENLAWGHFVQLPGPLTVTLTGPSQGMGNRTMDMMNIEPVSTQDRMVLVRL